MGKVGKPPKPPAVVFNNRLLLQLNALKEEKGRTWAEIQQLFVRLFPDEDFPPAVPLIRSAVQQFSPTTHNQQNFLQHDHDIYYTCRSIHKRSCVERLMAQHQTKTAKFSSLSVQLGYHRVVLGSGSKLLSKTKLTPDQITANLILYLGTSEGMSTPALQDVPPPLPAVEHEDAVEACRPERGRKRKRRGAKKTPRQEEAEGEEEENQEEQEQAGQTEDGEDVMLELEDGKFSQGQAIAVYYDNNFYLGEVLQSHEDDTAEVSFMDQVPNKNIFRWKHEDIDVVHKKFVFMWNVRLASQNGRSWSTADYVKLVRLYTLFQEEYCQ